MRYFIEVKDERDKDSNEPWSHWTANCGFSTLEQNLAELAKDIENNPIIEVRIKIERDK